MYCGNCGAKHEVGASVCPNCGKALESQIQVKDKIKEQLEKMSAKEGKTYFSAKKYLSYIAYFQVCVWAIYAVFILGGVILGFLAASAMDSISSILVFPLIVAIAFGLGWLATLFLKIRIQEMRWDVDIHNTIVAKK